MKLHFVKDPWKLSEFKVFPVQAAPKHLLLPCSLILFKIALEKFEKKVTLENDSSCAIINSLLYNKQIRCSYMVAVKIAFSLQLNIIKAVEEI